jgi:uncharacterized protein YbjT (DUF2867 family)
VRRRKGDSLAAGDDRGNRNLVDAARAAGVGRVVFTSILTRDQAPGIPHFGQKKLIEDYLENSGVLFVALHPGVFVGAWDFWARGLRRGRLMALGSASVRWAYVHIDDVARYLAQAVNEPQAVGRRIDIGTDRPVSAARRARTGTSHLPAASRVAEGGSRMSMTKASALGMRSPNPAGCRSDRTAKERFS